MTTQGETLDQNKAVQVGRLVVWNLSSGAVRIHAAGGAEGAERDWLSGSEASLAAGETAQLAMDPLAALEEGANPGRFTLGVRGESGAATVTLSMETGQVAVAENSDPGRLFPTTADGGAVVHLAVFDTAFNPATWMTELPGLADLPLDRICMPATHDSGAWTTFTSEAAVVRRYALTQTADIAGQLLAGARYFDVRPGRVHDGRLCHMHGDVACAPLDTILMQLRDFADAHPREAVFVNVSHMLDSVWQQAWDEITGTLGARMAEARDPVPTLGQVQASGHNVVVFFDGQPGDLRGLDRYRWNPVLIDRWNDYADSTWIPDLERFISRQVQERRPDGRFWLLQCQLTPGLADAIPFFFGTSSVIDEAAKSQGPVMQLIDPSRNALRCLAQAFAHDGNFFMVDAMNPDWTRMAVLVNTLRMRGTLPQVAGNPSLIQARGLGRMGNFEMVVPLRDRGMAHYFRNNDDPLLSWFGPHAFAEQVGKVESVSLIQSNYGDPGNLEVLARVGDVLMHFFRGPGWQGPFELPVTRGCTGNPALVQGRSGVRGNFEVVVPLLAGGIGHFFRNDDDGRFTFHALLPFGTELRVEAVSMIQSTYGNGFNLEVIARVGDCLYHGWRENGRWNGPFRLDVTVGCKGIPSLVQTRGGTHGRFEVVVPQVGGGIAHFTRDNDLRLPWTRNPSFGQGVFDEVSLIQSNFGTGNLEVLARQGGRLVLFWREPEPQGTWHGPLAVD